MTVAGSTFLLTIPVQPGRAEHVDDLAFGDNGFRDELSNGVIQVIDNVVQPN